MKEFNLSGTKVKVFYLEKPDPKKLEIIYDSINNLAMHLKNELIKGKESLD